jgi:putative ABC transport system permease protein
MFMFKLAVRNLFRNTRRTVLSMITLIVGTMSLVAAYGMILGVNETLTTVDIKTDFGHLRIYGKGYLAQEESFPLDIVVAKPNKVVDTLKKEWPKATVFKRVIFSAKVSDGTYGLNVRGYTLPSHASNQFTFLRKDNKPMPDKGNVIMIGYHLAKTFKKKVGDTFTLEARTQTGSLNATDFKIHHIFDAGNPVIDAFAVYIPETSGRRFLQMPKDVTDIVAFLPKRSDATKAESLIKGLKLSNRPMTWQEKAKDMAELQKTREKMFNFLIGILMLLAAAGLANTMLMAGYERKGEIGMMLAIGFPRSRIISLFAIEAGILGLIGSIIGAIFGSAITLYYQFNGLDISGKMEAMSTSASAISSANLLYFKLSPTIIAISLALGIVVAVLSAIWPANRITKLEPREILAGS